LTSKWGGGDGDGGLGTTTMEKVGLMGKQGCWVGGWNDDSCWGLGGWGTTTTHHREVTTKGHQGAAVEAGDGMMMMIDDDGDKPPPPPRVGPSPSSRSHGGLYHSAPLPSPSPIAVMNSHPPRPLLDPLHHVSVVVGLFPIPVCIVIVIPIPPGPLVAHHHNPYLVGLVVMSLCHCHCSSPSPSDVIYHIPIPPTLPLLPIMVAFPCGGLLFHRHFPIVPSFPVVGGVRWWSSFIVPFPIIIHMFAVPVFILIQVIPNPPVPSHHPTRGCGSWLWGGWWRVTLVVMRERSQGPLLVCFWPSWVIPMGHVVVGQVWSTILGFLLLVLHSWSGVHCHPLLCHLGCK